MLSAETLIKVAQLLGIETLGKSENEIKDSIAGITRSKTEAATGEFKIEDMARSLGKMFGEFEKLRNEFQRSVMQTQEAVTTPLIQTKNEIQRSVVQMQEEVKAPLISVKTEIQRSVGQTQDNIKAPLVQVKNELQRSAIPDRQPVKAAVNIATSDEKMLIIARILGVDTKGKKKDELQNEVKKVLKI